MAQDYVILNSDSNENGLIAINKSVFQSIAEISIDDIDNANRVDSTTWSKPISIRIIENKLHIYADVKVKYGANVNTTCELVQNKIYENVLFMTGFRASEIAVNVIGFEI